MTWQLLTGDCVEVMADMAEASVDAIVTDPPYGLHFMGKTWDQFGGPRGARNTNDNRERGGAMHAGEYDLSVKGQHGFQGAAFRWGEAMLRVLKPGGHSLIFGGTRTYHRLTCALEDAGFEIRDCLAWLYGSGFPKSLDVSKAIDKAAGAEREVVGKRNRVLDRTPSPHWVKSNWPSEVRRGEAGLTAGSGVWTEITAPATPDAERWQGWGTALKPAFEPIVLARKPLIGTVAANVLEYGTGALNIDGTRIEVDPNDPVNEAVYHNKPNNIYGKYADKVDGVLTPMAPPAGGRWPANVLLDDEAARLLDEQSGERPQGFATHGESRSGQIFAYGNERGDERRGYPGTGGASRFFYTAKSDRAERNRGLEHRVARPSSERHHYDGLSDPRMDHEQSRSPAANSHPTVKPVDLMQWLCRLITPPHGLVLDPFTGSGSTGIAALREGFDFIGIEKEPEYVEIARDRIIGDAPLFNVGAEVTA